MKPFLFFPNRYIVRALPAILALFSAASAGAAPNTLTPDAIAKDVLARNPEAAFYEAEIAAAKGEYRTAGTPQNPEVATDIGSKRARERSGKLQGEGLAWSVSVQQTFDWPGRLSLRKAIANRQIWLAELGYSKFRTALSTQAKELAVKAAVAQQKAEIANEVTARFRALLEVLVQREAAGVTPLLEQRILEANSITLQRRASTAALEAKAAVIELNQLRGEALGDDVSISMGELPMEKPGETPAVLARALEMSFELKMRQAELEQQGFKVTLAQLDKMPSITVKPYYEQDRADARDTTAGIGVSLPLPLWNKNKGGVETAQARQTQAATSMLLSQRSIERQVREQLAILRTKLEEINRWRPDAAKSLKDAAELGDRNYRLGALPIATYTELQRQYLDATEALLDTKAEAYAAALELQGLIGVALPAPAPAPKNK
jgi:cobalt-zinc-cadmium efflux system outer membrane protein